MTDQGAALQKRILESHWATKHPQRAPAAVEATLDQAVLVRV